MICHFNLDTFETLKKLQHEWKRGCCTGFYPCATAPSLLQQLVQFIINGFDVRSDIVVLTQSQSSAPKATNCLKRQFPAHTLLWNCPAHKCAPWQAWKKDSRWRQLSGFARFNLNQLSCKLNFDIKRRGYGSQQTYLPKLRAQDETAVHWSVPLQMRHKLAAWYRIFWTYSRYGVLTGTQKSRKQSQAVTDDTS